MKDTETVRRREAAGQCIDCGKPLPTSGTVVGAGDGRGRKFVDFHCYLRRQMKDLGLQPSLSGEVVDDLDTVMTALRRARGA